MSREEIRIAAWNRTHARELAGSRRRRMALLASIFVVASCGLAYELLVGTATAYLRGDTVVWFSISIGVFMAAMGLGAHLSRRVRGGLLSAFLAIEIALALLGGLSTTILFASEVAGSRALVTAIVLLVSVGALVGADLPLVARLLVRAGGVRAGIADALSLDYLGGLAAALAFPLLLLPSVGILRSAILFGALNLSVVFIALRLFREEPIPGRRFLRVAAYGAGVVLLAAFVAAGHWLSWMETRLYGEGVIATLQTKHQRAVLTRSGEQLRLYLGGHLQFSSSDEHRYHETLVHPALAGAGRPRTVAIIGGGDGLAAREVLKHPSVERVYLVDYDSELVDWLTARPEVAALQQGALDDPRLVRVHEDGFAWLRARRPEEPLDAILVDLPDPRDVGLGRLYSVEFYALCRTRLREGGALAVQATSPWHAPRTFWTIVESVRAAGLEVAPMRVNVPSFGEWGFALAATGGRDPRAFAVDVPVRFLGETERARLFEWPADFERPTVQPNRLGDVHLARTWAGEWARWR